MATSTEALVRVARVADVQAAGRMVAQADGHVLVIFPGERHLYGVPG